MERSKIVIAITGVFLLSLLSYAWYLNIFAHVTISDKKVGGYRIVGLNFTGPYSKAGKFMMEVHKKLKDADVASTKGFGIYYDDPKITPKEKCRSYVGEILEEKDLDKIPKLKSLGFKVDSIPEASAVVSYFPIKSSLSYMIGPMKVYPSFTKYLNEKGYKSNLTFEVYDIPEKLITFAVQYDKK